MAEATNELAFLVTGAYGHPLARQHGAPLRLALPWKYGFKSIKSIVRFSFTDQRPKGMWEALQPCRVRLLGQRQSASAASALEPGDARRSSGLASGDRRSFSMVTATMSPASTTAWTTNASGREALLYGGDGRGYCASTEEPVEASMSSQQSGIQDIQGLQRAATAALHEHWVLFLSKALCCWCWAQPPLSCRQSLHWRSPSCWAGCFWSVASLA